MKIRAIAAARRAFGSRPMKIALRAARPVDYGFARQLCFTTMRELVEQTFGWDEYSQDATFARQFVLSEVRIITLDGEDIGWIQTQSSDRTINLGQFFIAPERQGRGIGSAVLKQLLAESGKRGKDMSLSVMKGNPALGFYRRHGFRVTHEDRYKSYLRFEPKHPLRGIGPSMGMRRG
jgi:GNAT superfamily N-acetyltransferase